MLRFNNTDIFTGYLKQLLSDFNLPTYRVYTSENYEWLKKYGVEKHIIETVTANSKNKEHVRYVPYIKDGEVQEFIDGKWLPAISTKNSKGEDVRLIQYYTYGSFELNHTKNLVIKDNVYDSYTHEYLGDYLRFMRDYNNVDLMPLYNCFGNRTAEQLKITNKDTDTRTFEFNTNNTKYKIYMLPVKLFKNYTIAIDSSSPVELVCGIYGFTQNNDSKFDELYGRTYQKINQMKFSEPLLYTKLTEIDELADADSMMELAQNESDLKLFIKLDSTNTSSITVLEGDYTCWNDSYPEISFKNDNTVIKKTNHWITNQEYKGSLDTFTPITQLQLLQLNTGVSYPFADRLIEYLTGNVINNMDENGDNIKRAQTVMSQNKIYPTYYGLQEDWYRIVFYDWMSRFSNLDEEKHDILGYIDKDVEKRYAGRRKTVKQTSQGQVTSYTTISTISGVDIYPDLYNVGDK